MPHTENEVVTIGGYCEALMRDDTFNMLVKEFQEQSVRAMLVTEPHEHKKREGIYAEIRGFDQFIGLLRTYVEQAQDILKKNDPAIADDSDA